jgi:hypothetical protein
LNVRITHATQTPADLLEAIGQVVGLVLPDVGEWENGSNPPRRDSRVVNSTCVAIEDSR